MTLRHTGMMFALVIFGAFFFPAQFAHAGAADYQSPGTYSFMVPAYSSLTVQVWGAGGGGGAAAGVPGYAGGNGGYSAFGGIVGYGGLGGTSADNNPGAGGAGGGAGGGTTNIGGAAGGTGSGSLNYGPGLQGGSGGSSPYGGGGGAGGIFYPPFWPSAGQNGSSPGGGGGGSSGSAQGYTCGFGGEWGDPCIPGSGGGGGGGYSSYTFSPGQLGVGGGVTIVIGGGGASAPYGDAPGGQGGNGRVYISWSNPPPASCSVSVTPNPKSYAGSATLSWSSSNAHYSVWINNVGYVGGSGSTTVAPYSNTDYSCYANGYGGSDGWHQYWLTVNPPASCSLPWGGSLGHGGSVTAYQTPSVPYNQTCNSQTRTCNNGSLSGNYNHASCTVSNPPPTATISVSPTSITQGQCTTVSWSSTNATSCTGTNFSTGGATSGSVQACPSKSTTYSCTCTRPGSSTVQCTGSGQGGVGAALTVSCTQAWSCTGGGGQTITRTNTDCSTTEIDTCITPNFCSGGSSSCVTPVSTGTISITPRVVRSGYTATVSWSTTNAASCSVSGNGNSWSGLTGTQTSSPISGKATYTLSCDDGDADAVKDDLVKSASVYTAATFRED